MNGSMQSNGRRASSSRSRMRHGRAGRSLIVSNQHYRQPSRELEFSRFAVAALEELRRLWPIALADLSLKVVMAPLPTDRVVGTTSRGSRYPIDWRVSPDEPSVTLFRARIENSVRARSSKEPYLLQMLAEEALCRAVAEYLKVDLPQLLRGEGV